MNTVNPTIYFWVRLLACGVWFPAGINSLLNYEQAAGGMTHHGIPFASVLMALVIFLQIGGGILVIMNRWVWAVALAWFAFTIPATLLYHGAIYSTESGLNFIQFTMFIKNISILGGVAALVLLDPNKPSWLAERIHQNIRQEPSLKESGLKELS